MTYRTALVGNVAMNCFLLAKFLRQHTAIAADSFDFGGGVAMWHPAWEDGEFRLEHLPDGNRHWDWSRVPMTNGWTRPPWAKILGPPGGPPWFDTDRDFYDWVLAATPNRLCVPLLDVARTGGLRTHRTPDDLLAAGPSAALVLDDLGLNPGVGIEGGESPPRVGHVLGGAVDALRYAGSVAVIAEAYDLVVLFGPQAVHGAFLPRPFVTVEHATMRHVERRQRLEQQLLATAYQRAAHNVLMNADCVRSARALGLDPARYSFIPHPVDTEKFSPVPTARSQELRAAILEWADAEVLALWPTRHSDQEASGTKATATGLEAYARYVHEAEPAGAPRLHLLLCAWGSELLKSQALLREWGVENRVSWYPLLPKRLLTDLYQAADLVLDQFSPTVGSYGTITVEALATARPVITHVDEGVHAWCRDVLPTPPHWQAVTVDEAYDGLVCLAANSAARQRLGERGRQWVDRWHGPERVARLHAAVYERVLAEEPVPALAALAEVPG